MLKYIKGIDYTQFDHNLFVAAVQAQFPGTQVDSEGDNADLGTPGFVTVNLPDSDQADVLAILTGALPTAIASATLDQAKATACAAIMVSMGATMYGIFTDSSGNTWQVDPASRALMTGTQTIAASGATLPEGFAWVNNSNIPVPMTNATFLALTQAIFNWTQHVFFAAQTAKATVNALTTVADVQAYQIPAWPTS